MRKLQHVDEDALISAFHAADGPKAVKRLSMAIAYRDGVRVDILSERYDIPRSTIYAWLDRFEDDPVEAAICDDPRPGRPAALDPEEVVELASDITDGPTIHGFSAPEWTADLLQTHILEAYGVGYSEGHARRLLRQLGSDSVE